LSTPKKAFISIIISFSILFIFTIGFLWWNHYPPLPLSSNTPIIQVCSYKPSPLPTNLKIVSYNIHFGIGLHWNKQDGVSKSDFISRLDKIAEVLKNINADVVLLQEVDFKASRSHNIDQAKYLAERCNYPFIAPAIHQKERFHPSFHGLHGALNHGICVISKHPITSNEVKVFNHSDDMPFYLQWLYNPHGAQKVVLESNNEKVYVINLHLEPWSQKAREEEISYITNWCDEIKHPIILGGDFNTTPPESPKKMGYHMNDAPWFVDTSKWDIENEMTILNIRKTANFTEAIPPMIYLKNASIAYTFPSDDPMEKLDYIFAGNGAKILYGYVYHKASITSDHLPLVAYVKQKENQSPDTSNKSKVKIFSRL
jgi:endonuclease/exonuclease/phosphatase family metal-dependent hydrolase